MEASVISHDTGWSKKSIFFVFRTNKLLKENEIDIEALCATLDPAEKPELIE